MKIVKNRVSLAPLKPRASFALRMRYAIIRAPLAALA
jgi:hypothetical protein